MKLRSFPLVSAGILGLLLAMPGSFVQTASAQDATGGTTIFDWFGGLVPLATDEGSTETVTQKPLEPIRKKPLPNAASAAIPAATGDAVRPSSSVTASTRQRKADMKSWVSRPDERGSAAPREIKFGASAVDSETLEAETGSASAAIETAPTQNISSGSVTARASGDDAAPTLRPAAAVTKSTRQRRQDMKRWVSRPEDKASAAPKELGYYLDSMQSSASIPPATERNHPLPASKPKPPTRSVVAAPASPTQSWAPRDAETNSSSGFFLFGAPAEPNTAASPKLPPVAVAPSQPPAAPKLEPAIASTSSGFSHAPTSNMDPAPKRQAVNMKSMKSWVSRPAARPEPKKVSVPGVDPKFMRTEVDFIGKQPAGTLVVDTASRYLYLVHEGGKATRYGIGVGRQGFTWKGKARIGHKKQWPDWHPPAEMRKREPWLPAKMEGSPDNPENPLGARALYLYEGGKDTLYRIHGTNQPATIGQAVSSGCIRMLNDDVVDLYEKVRNGTRVVVL